MEKTSYWGRAKDKHIYDRWPKDEKGRPEEPALLLHCKSLDMNDELTVNMLEAYCIPCMRMYPGDGGFGKLILGMSGNGVDLYVPASLKEEAEALCSDQADTGIDEV